MRAFRRGLKCARAYGRMTGARVKVDRRQKYAENKVGTGRNEHGVMDAGPDFWPNEARKRVDGLRLPMKPRGSRPTETVSVRPIRKRFMCCHDAETPGQITR